jgi:hypothetical protein
VEATGKECCQSVGLNDSQGCALFYYGESSAGADNIAYSLISVGLQVWATLAIASSEIRFAVAEKYLDSAL